MSKHWPDGRVTRAPHGLGTCVKPWLIVEHGMLKEDQLIQCSQGKRQMESTTVSYDGRAGDADGGQITSGFAKEFRSERGTWQQDWEGRDGCKKHLENKINGLGR